MSANSQESTKLVQSNKMKNGRQVFAKSIIHVLEACWSERNMHSSHGRASACNPPHMTYGAPTLHRCHTQHHAEK